MGILTCWYLKTLEFALPTMPDLKFALPPTQWNIGCVGSPDVGARVGHVHFMLFMSNSIVLDSQRKCGFQCNILAIVMLKFGVVFLQKLVVLAILKGMGVISFGPVIFPFCSPPPPRN